MRTRALTLVTLAALVVPTLAAGPALAAPPAQAAFESERPAGLDINPRRQGNWEPTVAVDPNHPNLVYQLITGINASAGHP